MSGRVSPRWLNANDPLRADYDILPRRLRHKHCYRFIEPDAVAAEKGEAQDCGDCENSDKGTAFSGGADICSRSPHGDAHRYGLLGGSTDGHLRRS